MPGTLQDPNEFLAGAGPSSSGPPVPALQDPNAFLADVGQPSATPVASTSARSSVLPTPLRVPLGLVSSAVKGGINALGIPNSLETLTKPIANWVDARVPALRALDNALIPSSGTVFPSAAPAINAARGLGIVDNPALAPQSGLERIGNSAVEAIGTTLPLAPLGVPAAISAGISGAGSQAATELFPGHPGVAAAVGLGTGLVGAGIVSKVENALNVKNLTSASAEAAQQAADAQSALDAAKTNAASAKLDSGDAIAGIKSASIAARDAKISQVQSTLDEINGKSDGLVQGAADAHGTSKTMQEAGTNLQEYARGWLANVMPAQVRAAWEPVDAAIPATTPVALPGYMGALQSMVRDGGPLAPSVGALTTKTPSVLLKNLQDMAGTAEATGVAQPTTWANVASLRSALGDAMANPQVARDISQQQISRLYASLTGDMRNSALGLPEFEGHLPVDIFDTANAATTRLHSIAEGPIAKLVSGVRPDLASDPNPEKAAAALLASGTKGATDIATLRQIIPSGVNELTAGLLNTNPGAWAKLSPEAKAALVPDSDVSSVLDSAIGAKALAAQQAKVEIAAAKAEHSATISQAQSDAQAASRGQQRDIIGLKAQANEASQTAANAVNVLAAAAPNKPLSLSELRNSLLSPALGGSLGAAMTHFLPNLSTGAMAGTAAGVAAAAPFALHAIGSAVTNPGAIAPALAGPYNALTLRPQ